MTDGRTVARAQGAFYGITGLWPLVHMRSFESLLGHKKEHWLVHSVSALLIADALSLLRTGSTPADVAAARRTGLGAAAALALIDVRYGASGRISRMYLADALIETGWIVAWVRAATGERPA
jgi:hypothetical protein